VTEPMSLAWRVGQFEWVVHHAARSGRFECDAYDEKALRATFVLPDGEVVADTPGQLWFQRRSEAARGPEGVARCGRVACGPGRPTRPPLTNSAAWPLPPASGLTEDIAAQLGRDRAAGHHARSCAATPWTAAERERRSDASCSPTASTTRPAPSPASCNGSLPAAQPRLRRAGGPAGHPAPGRCVRHVAG
jgi:hypothetical protein